MEENTQALATPDLKEEAPAQELISIEQFAKIDLRLGVIEEAESVPKSKKLLKLQVNLGEKLGKRQILSGISEYFSPEQLIGKRIVVVANLQPAKLMGHESQGMLLAFESDDHSKLDLIQIPEGFELGVKIR